MSTLVGRDRELNTLIEALRTARRGLGTCALLSGEAGIGKSRLIEELKHQAASEHFSIVQGNCFEQDLSLPYAPWADALRMCFAPLSPEEIRQAVGPLASEFTKLLPELRLLMPDVSENPPLEATAEKYRAFESISRFLLSAHAPRASLIVLEDLHWSDSLSLELMHFVARRISHLPILLIGTYRSEEPSSHLAQLLSELNREHLVQELALQLLNRAEVEQMARTMLETEGRIPAAIGDALVSLTDGNPFYVEEILKSWSEEGRIDELLERTSGGDLGVPGSIQRMVMQRVERLPQGIQTILIQASVIGQRFDFGLLQETTGQNEQELVQALKKLLETHLVMQASANEFVFAHALTRDAVRSMLMLRERKALHQRIGEALERSHAKGSDSHISELAYHFYQAETWDKALEYGQRAGERAQALYAPHEAGVFFTQAIQAAQQLGVPPPRPSLRGRAQAYEASGDFDLALADYEATRNLARHAEDRAAEWQACIDVGLLWQSRDLERAGEYYREAWELARHLEDPSLLAGSLNRIGNWHMNRGDAREARSYHRQALALFQDRNDRRGMAQTLELLGMVSYQLGEFSQGTTYLEQAVPILRELDDRQGLVDTLTNLIFPTRLETEVLGDTNYLRLVELSEEALQIARAANWRQGEARVLFLGGGTLAQVGDYSRALEWLSRAESFTEMRRSRESFVRLHLVYGAVFIDLLASAEARQHLETALAAAQELGSGLLMLAATAGLVSVLILQDDLERAKDLLDSSLPAEYPESQLVAPVRRLWSGRAELELAQGHSGRALEIVDRMLGSTGDLAQHGPHAIPQLSRLRARALAALGRMEEAEVELQGTLPVAGRQGQQAVLWRLHADLGKVYRAQGRRDDAEREFASARTIIEDRANRVPKGALREDFLRRALATMPVPHVPTPRQAAKKESGGLTAREREIASLIALGRSNREIADKLVISEKTAERHVANILSKLGFNSRTQIAVWAVEKVLDK